MISDFRDYLEKHRLIYEAFEREVSRGLQLLFDYVKREVGEPTGSFEKTLNLLECGFANMRVRLVVDFMVSNNTPDYHSNINIYHVIFGRDELEIPIRVRDAALDVSRLNGVIAHELKHVYDVLTVNDQCDMESFIKAMHLRYIQDFPEFADRVYLSLEHEFIARETSMYQEFDRPDLSRTELDTLFEKSYVREALTYVGSFEAESFVSGKDPATLLEYTNRFVNYFGGTPVSEITELKPFYLGWERFFRKTSEEYLDDARHVLDRISLGRRCPPVMEHFSTHSPLVPGTVRERLLQIYRIFILPEIDRI